MVVVFEAEHPLLSVAVTEYPPATSVEARAVLSPLFQWYAYGGVPPLPAASAEPSLPAKHLTFVGVIDTVTGAGCTSVIELLPVHPLASVAVTVYVPSGRPVTGLVESLA